MQHYHLEVSAMTEPMTLRESDSEYDDGAAPEKRDGDQPASD